MNTKEFIFIGFLSTNKKEKKEKLEEVKREKRSLIFYEAPHKLKTTLEDIKEIFGNRKIVLAKEITKIHEQFIRGNIEEIIKNIQDEPKGEYVIIIEGADKSEQEEQKENLSKMTLEEHYKYYENLKYEKKEIIKQIAKDRNVNKNEIYKYFL